MQSVNPSYSQDVLCQLPNSQPVLHLMTLTPDLNQVTVEEGRLPEKADEIFLDRDFFQDYGYQIGDKVQVFSGEEDNPIEDILSISEFTIVGQGTSPFYLSIDRGTSTIGNGTVGGFAMVPEEAFSMDAYTEIYLSVEGAEKEICYSNGYKDVVEEVKKRLEDLSDTRCEIRYGEIRGDGQEDIDKAREEIADARSKLTDGEEELKDGEKQLEEGKKELKEKEKELETAKSQLQEESKKLEDGKVQIDAAAGELESQAAVLAQKKGELEAGKQELTAKGQELEAGFSALEVGRDEKPVGSYDSAGRDWKGKAGADEKSVGFVKGTVCGDAGAENSVGRAVGRASTAIRRTPAAARGRARSPSSGVFERTDGRSAEGNFSD